jgi:hypothetical protein
MTETEWLNATDPQVMLTFLRGKVSERKLRLLVVACCRRTWHWLTDERSRKAVDVAERFADGLTSQKELYTAIRGACDVPQDPSYAVAPPYSAITAIEHARIASSTAALVFHPLNEAIATIASSVGHAAIAASCPGWKEDQGNWLNEANLRMAVERRAQTRLICDIFGLLAFRTVHIDPSLLRWNDRLVVRLAQTIYDERRWSDMPILADALFDAGCDNEEILRHCHEQEGVHSKGCWVTDLLLGKS